MDKDSIIEKLKKVLALAERGQNGEAASARNLLDRMLLSYGLTEDDLQRNPVRVLAYIVGKENSSHNILLGVIASYVLQLPVSHIYRHVFQHHSGEAQFIKAHLEEHAEMASLYEFFKAGFDRDMDRLKKSQQRENEDLTDQIKELKHRIKIRQEILVDRRKQQGKIRKGMLGAFVNKNRLMKFYHTEQERNRKSNYSIPDEAFRASTAMDKPNMLPGLKIEGGER